MKKLLSGLLVLGLCGTLCACAANNSAQTNNTTETTVEQTTSADSTKIVDKDEFVKSTGVNLSAPEGATDVTYLVLQPDEILKQVGEIQFSINGHFYREKVILTDKTSMEEMDTEYLQFITQVEYDWSKAQDVEIGSCKGKLLDTGYNCKSIVWLDTEHGMVYTLTGDAGGVSDAQIIEIAAESFASVK